MIDVNKIKSGIWYERYRPMTMEEILLPKAVKQAITKYINAEEIPHLLFYSSSPGVGKTSLCRIICNAIGAEYLEINASLYDSVDMLRSTVERFANSMALNDKLKIVILDEFGSGSSKKFQEGLKAFIETYQGNCRFIFTSNSNSSVLEYIKSRCQSINFDFKDEKVKVEMIKKIFLRLQKVFKKEGVECDDKILYEFVKLYFPDMRKMYGIIQSFIDQNGAVITKDILSFSLIDDILLEYIMNKNFTKSRELVIKGSYNYNELYRYLYDKLVPKFTDKLKQCESICIISEFMWRESQGVNDSEINFAHCLMKIIQIV